MEGSAAAPAPVAGKLASYGQPVKADMTFKPTPGDDDLNNNGTLDVEAEAAANVEKLRLEEIEKNKTPELSDEQLEKVLQGKGIKFDGGLEGLKSKLAPAVAEPTPEEKEKAEAAFEKRLLDFYMENGGKAEDYVNLKKIAASDLKELSVTAIKAEMKKEGFDDAEIEVVLKERYYQLNPDELQIAQDETVEDFEKRKELTKKKVSYGSKKLENRSSYIKKEAESVLGKIKQAIETKDLLDKKEVAFSAKVDEHLKTIPRKMKIDMGKVDNVDVAPVEIEIPESVFTQIAETLKDPAKRKQFFFNEDNSLNLSNVAQTMAKNAALEHAVKFSLLEGQDRQVKIFEKTFAARNAKDVGLGGGSGSTKTPKKGVLAGYGKPEVIVRNS